MNKRKKHNSINARMQGKPQQTTIPGMEADVQREEKYLYLSELYSGQPYQRPVKDSDVNKLSLEWAPRLLTPLVVSYRDGKYYLVDGQHRVCVLRQKNDGKDTAVLCRVFRGLTYEQEAELYYKLDRAKGHLRLPHATKALLESGSDPELVEVSRLLEEAGFIWALDKPTGKDFEIASTRTVINAYRLLGGTSFSRMLLLLAKTWHGAPSSLKSYVLSGMALFVKTYETELKDATFIKRMSTVDPEEIIRRGKADFSTTNASLRYARVIWDKYNGHQRGGRKLTYRFKG